MTAVDPDEVRERADEILSRPEYRERPRTLASRALDWILEQLDEVLGALFGGPGGTIVGYLVVLAGIGVALWFLWRFLPRRRLARPAPVESPTTATEERPGRREWLARAARAETEGRWDEAVHARYRALTEGLVDEGDLPDDPSLTTSEQRDHFARDERPESLVVAFDGTSRRYEDVRYGAEAADRDDADRARSADEQLVDGGR